VGCKALDNDPVVRLMREAGIPITREEYTYIAYMGQPPEEWTAELEAELPEELQLKGH
jgi:hypothetical protein